MCSQRRSYTVELIDGTFEGSKIVTSNKGFFRAFYFNRDDLPEIKKQDNIGQQGIYFLLRFNGNRIEKIYIGQTQVGIERIVTHCHKSSKNWFKYCFLLTLNFATPVSGNVFNGLEQTYINLLKKNKSFVCDNSQDNHSITNSLDKIKISDYKDEIDFLLQTCDINIYQNVISCSGSAHERIFKIKRNGLNARLRYAPDDGKFIVLDGSEIDMRHTADSVTGDAFRRRKELFNNATSIETLGCDVDFCSASAASSFVIGNSSNGKVDWVLESDGITPLKNFLV